MGGFIIIREKAPGLGNGLGCNTQASGAPNDGFFMPNHVFFMPNQRFALPKPGFRCQNLRWAADILTPAPRHPTFLRIALPLQHLILRGCRGAGGPREASSGRQRRAGCPLPVRNASPSSPGRVWGYCTTMLEGSKNMLN